MAERVEPVGLTIASGAYVVRERVVGEGIEQLWLATHVGSGAEVLVSQDFHYSQNTIEQLTEILEPDGPGILTLDFVGLINPNEHPDHRSGWVVVEHARGGWLPRVVGMEGSVPRAVGLGRSAAAILQAACERGLVLAKIRPELMFADGAEVTGLSTRAFTLFALSRGEPITVPIWATRYDAPEPAQPSAVVYALGVMVAEWATGHGYARPVYRGWGREQRDLALPMEIPDGLERLLRAAIDSDPAQRPSLSQFAAELARFA